MYILHRCVKAKVSFKKIKSLTEFLGLFPRIVPTTEISDVEFEHLLACLNLPEFELKSLNEETETMHRLKEVRKIHKLQESTDLLNKRAARPEVRCYSRNDDIDEEEQIMRALLNGNGDLFGF